MQRAPYDTATDIPATSPKTVLDIYGNTDTFAAGTIPSQDETRYPEAEGVKGTTGRRLRLGINTVKTCNKSFPKAVVQSKHREVENLEDRTRWPSTTSNTMYKNDDTQIPNFTSCCLVVSGFAGIKIFKDGEACRS